eukprot:7263889-Pyramimonas_sp.AAC.1
MATHHGVFLNPKTLKALKRRCYETNIGGFGLGRSQLLKELLEERMVQMHLISSEEHLHLLQQVGNSRAQGVDSHAQ